MRMSSMSAVLTLAVLAAAPARAQQSGAPVGPKPQPLALTVENLTAQSDAQHAPRKDARARPGDVLRYRLAFTNRTDRPIRHVVLDNPIPARLRLSAASVKASRADARVEYSIDGGRSWAPQPMEDVVTAGGKVRRPVSPERYTNVRWTVDGPVAAQAVVTAEFEAQVRPARSGAAETPAQKLEQH